VTTKKTIYSPSVEEIENRSVVCWNELKAKVEKCTLCQLCKERNNTVLGEGALAAPVMSIGEGPGADEDMEGKPFIGKAGKLLTKILEAADIKREEVYITNIVKCRPPNNRVPAVEEMVACSKYLEAQIAIIDPEVIVCLGSTPTKWFLKTSEGITKIRGKWFKWKGIDLMPMFHPSYLLRNQSRKPGSPKDMTWKDIQEIRKYLDRVQNNGGKTIGKP